MNIFAQAGSPYGGDAFLTALEAIATSGQPYSGSVKRLLQSIYPPAGGVDWTDQTIISELNAFVSSGTLTSDQVSTIVNATMVNQNITPDEISDCRTI